MNLKDDTTFLAFWEKNREQQRKSLRPFMVGLSAGFAIGMALILVLTSGWYERAHMVANSRLSSVVLLLAILLISCFMAYFYRKFRWEMLEQRYLELKARKKAAENASPKQPS